MLPVPAWEFTQKIIQIQSLVSQHNNKIIYYKKSWHNNEDIPISRDAFIATHVLRLIGEYHHQPCCTQGTSCLYAILFWSSPCPQISLRLQVPRHQQTIYWLRVKVYYVRFRWLPMYSNLPFSRPYNLLHFIERWGTYSMDDMPMGNKLTFIVKYIVSYFTTKAHKLNERWTNEPMDHMAGAEMPSIGCQATWPILLV